LPVARAISQRCTRRSKHPNVSIVFSNVVRPKKGRRQPVAVAWVEPPGECHRRLRRLGSSRPVGRERGDVVVLRSDPHAVATRVDRDVGEGGDESLSDAPPPELLVDRELVQEHLGALVRVGGLDPAHEAGHRFVDVREQQVMTGLGEELRGPPSIGR
jgi:hypothetical protein